MISRYTLFWSRTRIVGTSRRATDVPMHPVHSNANSTSMGSTHLQLLREDYLFTHIPLLIASYSFIQPSEREKRGVNEIADVSKWQQNSVFCRCSSHRVPHLVYYPSSSLFSQLPLLELQLAVLDNLIATRTTNSRWQVYNETIVYKCTMKQSCTRVQ